MLEFTNPRGQVAVPHFVRWVLRHLVAPKILGRTLEFFKTYAPLHCRPGSSVGITTTGWTVRD